MNNLNHVNTLSAKGFFTSLTQIWRGENVNFRGDAVMNVDGTMWRLKEEMPISSKTFGNKILSMTDAELKAFHPDTHPLRLRARAEYLAS